MDKAALIADITPMPHGYSGTIKIVKPESRIAGDTAILSYDLDETETIFGQNLNARYHAIDTWLRRNGVWQIVASQAMRYYEDPAIGKADLKKFPGVAGTYELAPGQVRTISKEGGIYSSSATGNAINSFRNRARSSSAKASKAGYCFAQARTVKSRL